MIRLFSIMLLAMLLNLPLVVAQEQNTPAPSSEVSNEETFEGFDFNDNSYYLTDEQLQEAKEIDKIDDNTSFTSKIINSGHFTSQTATKTYIPINKVTE